MAQDYWWVTRPKRKLNTIPEELAAFASCAVGKKWTHNRELHIAFEEELEKSGTKRVGDRRDAGGSGGRTHAAMLYSLGLWFEKNDKVYLTLAGEAILSGKSPVKVLSKQVMNFQYPSPYGKSVKINDRFKIHPFVFLLKLLNDVRIAYLMQEEIALIVTIQAENESDKCYERVVEEILRFRAYGQSVFYEEYLESHGASKNNLMDVANTMMNWLDYTQLVYREKKQIEIDESKRREVEDILNDSPSFIKYPVEADVYQRKYGVDPWHHKDTRNILLTETITAAMLDKSRVLRMFLNYSALKPVKSITNEIVYTISEDAGTDYKFTEEVLYSIYPHGAVNNYLVNYRNMAFQGRDEAIDFEMATTNLFHDIFGYKAIHLGQTGSKSAPDVLIISDNEGYQAIIDNKAYSKYSISGDHHNRMVHNYIRGINNYSSERLPIGFFTYISGGFGKSIDQQIQKIAEESGVHGSGITVSNLIGMIEKHDEQPYTHEELRDIFGLNRQILLADI